MILPLVPITTSVITILLIISAFIPPSTSFPCFSQKRTVRSSLSNPASFLFDPQPQQHNHYQRHIRPKYYRHIYLNEASKGGDNVAAAVDDDKKSTRQSLHPITIEALSDALLIRSTPSRSSSTPVDIGICDNDKTKENSIQPLDVAMAAGQIAAEALDRQSERFSSSDAQDMVFTPEENQVVAGRVVGVVMRMRSLESELIQRVKKIMDTKDDVDSVYEIFGVLQSECSNNDDESDKEREEKLSSRIRDDIAFGSRRAESLLAIFLQTVEGPTMEKIGQTLPGGSDVNFMDEDRKMVLLGDD
uniref:Uncharacterized protein n=1 Tax=Ditylum brightwellii TaxID=49249 RepID=A0A6U3XEV5_9STRA|mmetsp:Transcript_22796/g.33944  ORF Transcript_22796/g.33944 Transcript_22796/m.33944 type:complete len:303 (+) Transcript_22796:67-975(+)